jgi:hypothetical protein
MNSEAQNAYRDWLQGKPPACYPHEYHESNPWLCVKCGLNMHKTADNTQMRQVGSYRATQVRARLQIQ